AGTLKVKLAGALVGISGIHLLKSFIDIGKKDFEQVKWQIVIHVVFLFSTLMLAYTEKVLHSSHEAK
ncbi:MAG: TIGR00645 family protein, partial [Bdellovibrionia bacterium]